MASPALPGLATLHRAVTTRRGPGDQGKMCFTNPGLKTCTLSRPRSLVTVLLQLAISRKRTAGTWPSSHPPHTGSGRFLHRPQKMPPPVFRGPARCALSIVKWVPRRAPRVPAVRPARNVPERYRAGRGAFIGPRRAASPSPGPFYATLIVPERPVRRWKLR